MSLKDFITDFYRRADVSGVKTHNACCSYLGHTIQVRAPHEVDKTPVVQCEEPGESSTEFAVQDLNITERKVLYP